MTTRKRLWFLACLLSGLLLFPWPPARAESTITFGPYVQRVGEEAGTVFIRTDEDRQLTLYYRKQGIEKWKSISDGSAKTIHRFRLSGLKRGQFYEYYLADGNDRLTRTYTFRTRHDVSEEDPLRVAVVGDYGTMNTDQLRVVTQIMQWEPALLLTTGDNAYDFGTLSEFSVNVFKPYQALLAEVPVYASIGNHDYATDNAGPYKQVFELPTANSNTEDYYSFNYDTVHLISLNSNIDFSVGSAMYDWLESDLAANADASWIIVFFHHPVFSSGPHGSTADMEDTLVPLFEQYNVDLVLNGHDHDYERNRLVNGVLYVVSGGGGQTLYDQTTDNPNSKYFLSEYHFVGLKVTDESIKLKATDKRGFVFDRKTLTKE